MIERAYLALALPIVLQLQVQFSKSVDGGAAFFVMAKHGGGVHAILALVFSCNTVAFNFKYQITFKRSCDFKKNLRAVFLLASFGAPC